MATFSQFSSLPTELRRLIWLHCLPSRVAAVDIPRIGNDSWNAAFGEGNQEYCLLSTSHRNAAPPIVSQVCRESRDVALEVGHALAYGVFQGLETVWVQPSRDVLHLNWDREWCIADGDAVGTTSAIPNFFALAAERNMIVSVCADLFLPFDIHSVKTCSDRLSDQDLDDAIWFDPDSVDEVLLVEHAPDAVFVALTSVLLQCSETDAIDSGLFGHYGEERIQMIDFNDTMKLHLFTKFWAKCAGGEQNASPETSLWNLCTSNEIQDRVRDWVKRAQIQLFGHLWLQARSLGFAGIGDPDNIWVPAVTGDRSPFNPTNRPNPHHPWAILQLGRLPELIPKIVFIQCSREC